MGSKHSYKLCNEKRLGEFVPGTYTDILPVDSLANVEPVTFM
jgi:hypothetical protein